MLERVRNRTSWRSSMDFTVWCNSWPKMILSTSNPNSYLHGIPHQAAVEGVRKHGINVCLGTSPFPTRSFNHRRQRLAMRDRGCNSKLCCKCVQVYAIINLHSGLGNILLMLSSKRSSAKKSLSHYKPWIQTWQNYMMFESGGLAQSLHILPLVQTPVRNLCRRGIHQARNSRA